MFSSAQPTSRNRLYFIRKHLHGFQATIALGYFLLTRTVRSLRMPTPLVRRLWAGVKDGWRIPV